MITYRPPKSKWWGHQVSRLSAVQVIDRGLRFLSEKAALCEGPPSSELTILWASASSPALPTLMAHLKESLGTPAKEADFQEHDGRIARQYRWNVPADRLRIVAEWFDSTRALRAKKEVVAQCIAMWGFDWLHTDKSVPQHLRHSNMFGIHLCDTLQISTMFAFATVDDYFSLKAFLAEIGLVELSDRHVRPKGSVPAADRRVR